MTDTLQSGAESALDLDKLEALARAATPDNAWPFNVNAFRNYLRPAAVLDLIALARRATAPHAELTVWEGPMPESNGKSNFTAILMRKSGDHWDNMTDGVTIDRSEYPDRVRYEADRVRYLIGERVERPELWDKGYDFDKHSDYVSPAVGSALVAIPRQLLEDVTGGSDILRDCALHALRSMICDSAPTGALVASAEPLGYITKESMSHLRDGSSVMAAIHAEVEPGASDFCAIFATPTESAAAPAGLIRAGWFLYEGIAWTPTSSDDPRATILYRLPTTQAEGK